MAVGTEGHAWHAAAGPQAVASLDIDMGRADTDVLVVGGDVSIKNGALTTELLIGGDLNIDLHGAVSAVGGIAGRVQLASSGALTVSHTGPVGQLASGFLVGDRLHVAAGSRLVLKPGLPSDKALLTVAEGMLVGTPQKAPAGNMLVGMLGAATVDLSQSGPLSPGVYKLIEFSGAPVPNRAPAEGSTRPWLTSRRSNPSRRPAYLPLSKASCSLPRPLCPATSTRTGTLMEAI